MSSKAGRRCQLLQFLTTLLLNPQQYSHIIHWESDQGEFVISNSRVVASLWGEYTGRPQMTYSTMGRALRHCYAKGTLTKMKHKRCGYKFSEEYLGTILNPDPNPEEFPCQQHSPYLYQIENSGASFMFQGDLGALATQQPLAASYMWFNQAPWSVPYYTSPVTCSQDTYEKRVE